MKDDVISALSLSIGEDDPSARNAGKGSANKADPSKLGTMDEDSLWEGNSAEYPAGGAVGGALDKDRDADGAGSGDTEDDRGVESLYADLSCLCLPTCATRPREVCSRSGGWALANADQFISSIIVAISLVPEGISYALIAGLPPSAALQSGWITNVVTAAVGGRPGMITSASGLAALLLVRLVRTDTAVEEPGIMFVPYVVIFAGLLECVAAFLGLGRLVSAFPAPVVVGMVNAMALLILALQFRYAKVFPLAKEDAAGGWDVVGTAPAVEVSWEVPVLAYFGSGFEFISPSLDLGIYFVEVATAFVISMFLPKVTTFLPATLVSVLVVVAVEFGLARQFGVETPLIGDYGGAQVQSPWSTIFSSRYALPSLASWESWKIILGYGCTIFATQFTETAIALNVVDRLDESQGPGFLVLVGQGIANVVSGLLGGMGGSGVVSMSVLADRTFGTTCLSTFMTGLMMFVFVTWGYPVIDFIPLSAVSGISVAMVCSFIQWRSMLSTFTTCLPSDKRDALPPQYNIARFDVFVMLFVTAACLIVDVATLLFFVMGLATFLLVAVRAACARRRERRLRREEAREAVGDLEDELDMAEEAADGAVPVDDEEGEEVAYPGEGTDTEGEFTDEEVPFPITATDDDEQGGTMEGTGGEGSYADSADPSWGVELADSAEEGVYPQQTRGSSRRKKLS